MSLATKDMLDSSHPLEYVPCPAHNKTLEGTRLTARPFREYLVQENLSFYRSFLGSKAWPLSSPLCPKMNIRTYKETDFEEVDNIYTLSKLDELVYENTKFDLIPLQKDKKRYTDFKMSNIYVAEQNGMIVGFLGYRQHHISWLFVHPIYRGNGIGNTMISFIKSKLQKDISLYVASSNISAISLYEKQGFQTIREFTGEYSGISVKVIEMKYNTGLQNKN